ncbi:MAG: DNA primase [Bacteroidales bacterium]|nr:DNA primase [Bacteroidales bacterium]
MIPHDIVDRILDTAQIVDVVGDFVTLKKRGSNYTACCPFHNEKTPSFSVSATKGIYKCFGCGKSGTAVGFVMEHEHMTYTEALKYLAKKYNIEVIEKEESAEDIAKRQRHESLLLVSEFGGRFFQESLDTPEGQTIAYQYFRSRGLQDETIRKYGLGWAPVSRRALSEAARAAGYKEEFLIETGLSIKYDDGRLVDRFFDRVIFPIHSVSGRVIAFGGRTLKTDKSVAKYVNSPETEIYVKSKSLYGIYFAKSEISKKNKCILVEGYLDVLSMHQLGITNVVASSGTSLTEDQIRLIHKFTDNITVIYDGDSAGIHAALRGTDMILKEGMNVKIILLPDGQDPDDFARKHTLEEVEDYISRNEQDFISFKTDVLLKEAGHDPLKRAELINDISDTIAVIPDAVVRAMYVRSSAERFGIDENLILDRIGKTRTAMIEAEIKRREREKQKAEQQGAPADSVPMPDYADYPEDYMYDDQSGYPEDVPVAPVVTEGFENPKLAPCEKVLLKFILEEGCTTLDFDRDSKYYAEGMQYNVAEFIDGSLAEDEADFFNSAYRKTYEEYFRFYEEGLSQQQIQQRLLNHMDEQIAAVTKELLIEKYQITVKNYENSMTAVSTQLVIYVPKTLMSYQCTKVELLINELMAELSSTEDQDRQMEILTQISEYNRTRTILNKELGRV